jgi:hypothetical protein
MVSKRAVQFLLASTLIVASKALALEGNWTHYGVRPLGMGNAFVGVANDFNALYYNPAGLARLDDWYLEIINPQFEISADTVSVIKEVQELGGSGAGFAKVLTFVEKHVGETHHFGTAITPYFVKKHFGLGIAVDAGFSMQAHSDLDIGINLGSEVLVPISFATNWLDDKLSLGVTAKLYSGFEASENLSINSISSLSKDSDSKLKDLAKGGKGVGFDAGLLFTPIKTMSPTLGVMIADVGDTRLTPLNDTLGKQDARPMSVNVGMSIRPIDTGSQYILLAADTHQINQPIHFSHKLSLGAEWGLGRILKLQTGLHDGQFTAGTQIDVKLLKIRFATYAIDHGAVAGSHDSLIDRRYVLQLKLLI